MHCQGNSKLTILEEDLVLIDSFQVDIITFL